MNKFFVKNFNADSKNICISDINDVNHIKKSLRLKKGDKIEISNTLDLNVICSIEEILDDAVTCVINEYIGSREKSISVDLYQSVLKLDKFEKVIKQSIELGVKNIYPVDSLRTISKIKKENKLDRYNKIALEAAKQSKRGIIPVVNQSVKINSINCNAYDVFIICYENEMDNTIKDVILNNDYKNIGIMIGPEGGFDQIEINILLKEYNNIQVVTFGNTILRSETAPIFALSCIFYESL